MQSPISRMSRAIRYAGLSRRRFLVRLQSLLAGSLLLRTGISMARDLTVGGDQAAALLARLISGRIVSRHDDRYEITRKSMVWQMRRPAQYPRLIVRPQNVEEVAAAVKFARQQKMQISVRCGGHAYNGSFLVDKTLLLDLALLRETEVDSQAMTVKAGPAIRAADLVSALGEHELCFPAAHCGDVPLGGFLLGGGLGWNGEAWGGMSCLNVREVEVVTPEGHIIVANEHKNRDWYWAARGGGPCFPGIVTRFTLPAFKKPAAVYTNTYIWPLSHARQICRWASKMCRDMPSNTEILFILADAQGTAAEKFIKVGHSKVCIVQATVFTESEQSAARMLKPMSTVPLSKFCLSREELKSTPIEDLYHWDATAYPNWRWYVDCLWTDSDPADVAGDLIKNAEAMPSARSSILFLFKPRTPVLPDAAFSMIGKTYIASYALWGDSSADAANENWVHSVMKSAKPYTKGHYINETAYLSVPGRLAASYSHENWQRLNALKKKLDPANLIHTNTI